MTDTRAAFGKALSWHCTSVFVTDSESSNCGAILHGFDGRSGKPLDVYTEATGYAISLFHFLARTRGDAPLLAMANEAAQFLMRIQAGESAWRVSCARRATSGTCGARSPPENGSSACNGLTVLSQQWLCTEGAWRIPEGSLATGAAYTRRTPSPFWSSMP
jgi:hypothetical protein